MEPNTQETQHNLSYEEVIVDHPSETGRIAPRSGQHIEEIVTNFVEILSSYVNQFFDDPLSLPPTDPPSKIYSYAFSSYYLLPDSTNTSSFCMNPLIFFFFVKDLGIYPFPQLP